MERMRTWKEGNTELALIIVVVVIGGMILVPLMSYQHSIYEDLADGLSRAYIAELELHHKYYYTLHSYHSGLVVERTDLPEIELISKIIRDQEMHERILANDLLREKYSVIFTMNTLECKGESYRFPRVEYRKYSFEELIKNEMEVICIYEEILEDAKEFCERPMADPLTRDIARMLRNKWEHIREIQKMTGLEVVSDEERYERRGKY